MAYAVVVTSIETKDHRGNVFTAFGTRFWAVCDEWGISTTRFTSYSDVPKNIRAFDSYESADKFGKEWKGHPWWVDSCAWEVVGLIPRMIEVQDGWKTNIQE